MRSGVHGLIPRLARHLVVSRLSVSRSAVRRFPNAHLTLVRPHGQQVNNWFEEGLPPDTGRLLFRISPRNDGARMRVPYLVGATGSLGARAGGRQFADGDDLVRDKAAGFASMFRTSTWIWTSAPSRSCTRSPLASKRTLR
jgi:hypothetical protein